MKKHHVILAIETSGKSGSAAILRFEEEVQLDCKMVRLPTNAGSAKTLAPAVHQLLSEYALAPKSISAIALLTGPGSFTGLRVGVAMAKAMAYAIKIPTIEIDTLDVIAAQCPVVGESVYAILDAYRGQVFCAEFSILEVGENARWTRLSPTEIVDIDILLDRASGCGDPHQRIDLCGPGCDRIRRFFQTQLEQPIRFCPEFVSRIRWIDGLATEPHAESVARLAYKKWLGGDVLDPFVLQPRYFRGSAAEESAARSK